MTTTPQPCQHERGEYVAHVGAPGYGQAGECPCGARLWRASASSPWEDVRTQERPPELSMEDVR